MSFVSGKDAEIWLEGADISTQLKQLGFKATTAVSDTTCFKSKWKSSIPGQSEASLDFGGLYDTERVDIETVLPSKVGGAIITAGPAGLLAVGDRARLALADSASYSESDPVGDVVAFQWSVKSKERVGLGACLHPMQAETADGNSASIDNLVPTLAGAIAHLHVFDVSAGDTLTVKVQDSATGASWADVVGGAFSVASDAGAQRIIIPGTIRRYVRLVWTLGGDGSPSIVFGAAIARL